MLVVPSIISFTDDSQNLAIFIDMNEEEEKKGQESSKDLELKIQTSDTNIAILLSNKQKKKDLIFKSKKYSSQYLKIDTPPPKFVL